MGMVNRPASCSDISPSLRCGKHPSRPTSQVATSYRCSTQQFVWKWERGNKTLSPWQTTVPVHTGKRNSPVFGCNVGSPLPSRGVLVTWSSFTHTEAPGGRKHCHVRGQRISSGIKTSDTAIPWLSTHVFVPPSRPSGPSGSAYRGTPSSGHQSSERGGTPVATSAHFGLDHRAWRLHWSTPPSGGSRPIADSQQSSDRRLVTRMAGRKAP